MNKGAQTTKIQDYVNSPLFILPKDPLFYRPTVPCSFASQGEQMVELLISMGPKFYETFNNMVPLDLQAEIAQKTFISCRSEWLKSQNLPIDGVSPSMREKIEVLIERTLEEKSKTNKKYFQTRRQFSNLVPYCWKRTQAPRVTTTGSTFHGMKKDLKFPILKEISKVSGLCFADLDMSAAHARIALSLLGRKSKYLKEAVNSSKFWDDRTTYYLPSLNEALSGLSLDAINPKQLRAMLKVSLYTSLNGGNPFGPARLLKNVNDNALHLLSHFEDFEDLEKFKESSLYKVLYRVFEKDELIKEVKDLNKSCFSQRRLVSHTIDRVKPYKIDKPHKGISRVLQSFEVVLLSVLVRSCLKELLLPVSLDHDGLLIAYRGNVDIKSLSLHLTRDIEPWVHFLLSKEGLDMEMPIESKLLIVNGEIYKT